MASQSVTQLDQCPPKPCLLSERASTARKTILFCFKQFRSPRLSCPRYSISELHKVFPPLFTLCLSQDPNSLMYFPPGSPPLGCICPNIKLIFPRCFLCICKPRRKTSPNVPSPNPNGLRLKGSNESVPRRTNNL